MAMTIYALLVTALKITTNHNETFVSDKAESNVEEMKDT